MVCSGPTLFHFLILIFGIGGALAFSSCKDIDNSFVVSHCNECETKGRTMRWGVAVEAAACTPNRNSSNSTCRCQAPFFFKYSMSTNHTCMSVDELVLGESEYEFHIVRYLLLIASYLYLAANAMFIVWKKGAEAPADAGQDRPTSCLKHRRYRCNKICAAAAIMFALATVMIFSNLLTLVLISTGSGRDGAERLVVWAIFNLMVPSILYVCSRILYLLAMIDMTYGAVEQTQTRICVYIILLVFFLLVIIAATFGGVLGVVTTGDFANFFLIGTFFLFYSVIFLCTNKFSRYHYLLCGISYCTPIILQISI